MDIGDSYISAISIVLPPFVFIQINDVFLYFNKKRKG